MATFTSVYGPFTIDQYGVLRDKDRNIVVAKETNPIYKDYCACLENRIEAERIELEFAETMVSTVPELRLKHIVLLRDNLDTFANAYKMRFPSAEISAFSDKVEQAKSYLANGLTDVSMPLKLEADLLKLTVPDTTVDTVVADIMRNYNGQRILIPFISAIRQAATVELDTCTYTCQMKKVVTSATADLTARFEAYVQAVMAETPH